MFLYIYRKYIILVHVLVNVNNGKVQFTENISPFTHTFHILQSLNLHRILPQYQFTIYPGLCCPPLGWHFLLQTSTVVEETPLTSVYMIQLLYGSVRKETIYNTLLQNTAWQWINHKINLTVLRALIPLHSLSILGHTVFEILYSQRLENIISLMLNFDILYLEVLHRNSYQLYPSVLWWTMLNQ